MTKRVRGAEPRIDKLNPLAHPKRFVCLAVAADYLEIDRKTLNIYLLDRKLEYQDFGSRRKIAVTELVAFLERKTVERKAG